MTPNKKSEGCKTPDYDKVMSIKGSFEEIATKEC